MPKKWIKSALGIKRRRLGIGPHHRKSIRVAGAHKGALHRQLGVPLGEKIPIPLLQWASGQSGKLGHRARLALTLRKFKKRRHRR